MVIGDGGGWGVRAAGPRRGLSAGAAAGGGRGRDGSGCWGKRFGRRAGGMVSKRMVPAARMGIIKLSVKKKRRRVRRPGRPGWRKKEARGCFRSAAEASIMSTAGNGAAFGSMSAVPPFVKGLSLIHISEPTRPY